MIRSFALTALLIANIGQSSSELPSYLAAAAIPKIAFVSCPSISDDCEIEVIAPDGRGRRSLTDNSFEDEFPAWSPNGKRIAFTSDRDGNLEIYVMNADGSGQTNLTDNLLSDDRDPAWSPNGKQIAFTSNRDGNDEIYVMNGDGSGQTGLTDLPSQDSQPAWSPDGSHVAFTVCPSMISGGCDVHVMAADGSGQTNLTNNSFQDEYPAWSPDGKRIAFASDRDVNFEIYVMDADGSGQTNLTNNEATDFEPAWSPDGRKIAFTSNRPDSQIYVMNADGSGQRNLTGDAGISFYSAWGPDTDPPQTRITSGPSRSTTDRTPTFRFRSDEPRSRFRCKLDSRSFRSCDSPKSYDRLPVGRHTFKVRAIDSAGNADPTPATFTWTIDRR